MPLVVLVLVLAPGPGRAATIENTATVSYRMAGSHETATLVSNTVRTQVLPVPSVATLAFLGYDPDGAGGQSTTVDGGQCRLPGGGFVSLPGVRDLDGNLIDQPGSATAPAPGYYVGEPVIITLHDANRNADPAVREFVEITLATTTGDAEALLLRETGVDTAMFAAAIQSVPIPPQATHFDCMLSLADQAVITARYADTDSPLGAVAATAAGYAGLPPGGQVLRLEQTVSRQFAEVGDFVQYTLVVRNTHAAPIRGVRIVDQLPAGVRFRAGSLHMDNPASATALQAAPAAAIGPAFEIPVGDMAASAMVTATFVAEVGSGARGPLLVNEAVARAHGPASSNQTETAVRLTEALASGRMTIVGRVAVGTCEAGDKAEGVPGVRLLMEDGTFVTTDQDGSYHFEGVRPGSHVVQIDLPTLPEDVEAIPCKEHTRLAGRPYSQFVEGQGGSLLRADFRLHRNPPEASEVGLRLEPAGANRIAVLLDGGYAPVEQLRLIAMLPAGTGFVPGSATLDGNALADPQTSGNAVVFDLGDPGAGWKHRLEFDTLPGNCAGSGSALTATAVFREGGEAGQRTPQALLSRPCGPPPAAQAGERVAVTVATAPEAAASSPFAKHRQARLEVRSAEEAAGGGDVNWFEGQAPGRDLVFPAVDYNPRSATTRVVVKSLPGDTVRLLVNGVAVPARNLDGASNDPLGTMTIRAWRGVSLAEGENLLQAEISDSAGKPVATIERVVHLATTPARAELVAAQSILVADGLHNPVIAVRMLDHAGRPVRQGVAGDYSISQPYTPAYVAGEKQGRLAAGLDLAKPNWVIEGDDGIAYIELAPTGVAGSFTLGFNFAQGELRTHQQLEGWLKSTPRDWVVVGIAEGSVGYRTLEDNMQALPLDDEGGELRTGGKLSLYAKGRVLGKWMLTLAYDSDKEVDERRRTGLLSTIDPGQYYTLYGDNTQQGYDASSARKLYLKLERDQFYALFGDFVTGLDRNELSRYQRTLAGIKVEYHGEIAEFNGFAARTGQSFARDELPGDGTSGLYRLRRHGILVNSERVRIETRDRYHSERILRSRELVRHIDYDIDYQGGTLYFREPVAGRDFDFNPNWIVVEYETAGAEDEFLNAGGRAGVKLLDRRLEAGISYIRDEDQDGRSRLAGVDAKFQATPRDEIRAEFAATRRDGAGDAASANAWLLQWQHRGERYDLLAYARRQAPGFGLGQQHGSESGMAKAGVQGHWRVDERFSLHGEAYRLENLGSGAVRDVASVEVGYRQAGWNARAGIRRARDEARDGRVAESTQATLGANRKFLDDRLELGVDAAFAIGGRNASVDFPTRVAVSAAYRVNEAFRLLAAQEFTDGKDIDTETTRIGAEITPWANARLSSTLNQSRITEYGPRTYAQFGLSQQIPFGPNWSFDLSLDSSRSLLDAGQAPIVVDPALPILPGGPRDGGALTEDYTALSGGASYRNALWAWNMRAEARHGERNDRYGFTTSFVRQVRDGVAFAASAQAFSQRSDTGGTGLLASARMAWAYRPSASRWSILDKLEFRFDDVQGGTRQPVLGHDTPAVSGNARSRRLVNNFVLNYAADAWADGGEGGNVFSMDQGSQVSLYYGSKYVLDTYDGEDHAGYTDIIGAEWRYDLSPRIDVGLRTSMMHSWSQDTIAWAFGPSIGFTPFTNAWVSFGYNIRGFSDRDFEDDHHTAQGPYLVLRMKFDQQSLGLDRSGVAVGP